MKKISLFLIIAIMVTLNSCMKDKLNEPLDSIVESEAAFIPDLEKKEILITMGFHEDEIEEYDNYFLVEGDAIIYKEAISEDLINLLSPVSNLRQRRYSALVNDDIVGNIRVRIGPNFKRTWHYLIEQALTAWNLSLIHI